MRTTTTTILALALVACGSEANAPTTGASSTAGSRGGEPDSSSSRSEPAPGDSAAEADSAATTSGGSPASRAAPGEPSSADSESPVADESTPIDPATGEALDDPEGPSEGPEASDDPEADALSFEADIWPVFESLRDPEFVYPGAGSYMSCVAGGVCHGGAAPGAGLSMTDPESAYAMLLGVPSSSGLCDGTLRVVVGDPDQSCLVLFYEGRLRDELGWVEQDEIDLIRAWIEQGALP